MSTTAALLDEDKSVLCISSLVIIKGIMWPAMRNTPELDTLELMTRVL